MDENVDVLVKWDDGTTNVVALKSLKLENEERLKRGAKLKMWWPADNRWWFGICVDHTSVQNDDDDDDDESDDDDLPLSHFRSNHEISGNNESSSEDDPTYQPSEEDDELDYENENDNAQLFSKQHNTDENGTDDTSKSNDHLSSYGHPGYCSSQICSDVTTSSVQEATVLDKASSCEDFGCNNEVFAACPSPHCLSLLCYTHFTDDSPCFEHNRYITEITNTELSQPENLVIEEERLEETTDQQIDNENSQPEDFLVEGERREVDTSQERSTPKDLQAKRRRNFGESYVSPSTQKDVPARRILRPRCASTICDKRGLRCSEISENERSALLNSFYNMGYLHCQREWIARHVVRTEFTKRRSNRDPSNRKKGTFQYHLPLDCGKVRVCRTMFLNTMGISERQIRTTINKTDTHGVVQPENRGGRHNIQKQRDMRLRKDVREHINRFPRVESHYCRAKTSYQYLAPDLTVIRMYNMYKSECNEGDPASFQLYFKVFKSLKLKFHKPKKDLCGLCDSYRSGNEEEKALLYDRYQAHIMEKEKVREIKAKTKEEAIRNPKLTVASFDLQQVIYLPRSNRCEVFYKRRLACYNFTLYELGTKVGHCYVWHEGIARRGANEIASNVYTYLKCKDNEGYTEVVFFADGCGGQNKNSILPTMFLHFVKFSKSIKSITLMFFETSHGQNEGDSVHSTIERSLKKHGDMFHPIQLSSAIKLARTQPFPYIVHDINQESVLDWKLYSKQLGVLRGSLIDWTKFMQLRVQKDQPDKIMYKISHGDQHFFSITIGHIRRGNNPNALPRPAFINKTPALSSGKYIDLTQLCSGITPVIPADFHAFYRNLSH